MGGEPVKIFEEAFAEYIGARFCVGCGNGTDALEIILEAIGIRKGDEVIVPACSWVSTSQVVRRLGGTPVFADILPNLYTIDPSHITSVITDRTVGIIPVHLYGLPARMDGIMKIANQHGLWVVEDCAQAHGALIDNQKVGTFGVASAFSFYPGKNLGAYGDAGAIITNDPHLAGKARMIANHGQKVKHDHQIDGRNSRLDTLQALILSVKLKYLDGFTQSRIDNANIYSELLPDYIEKPRIPDAYKHVFHLYVVRVEKRQELMGRLKANNIQAAIHYPTPLPFLPVYKDLKCSPEDYPVAYSYIDSILSLPMFPELTKEQIIYVCECLLSFFNSKPYA